MAIFFNIVTSIIIICMLGGAPFAPAWISHWLNRNILNKSSWSFNKNMVIWFEFIIIL